MTRAWEQFRDELATWQAEGLAARFWWRDDDATGFTPALSRLLALQSATRAPLALAVIPAQAETELLMHETKGLLPAMIALFLYALLPIVRNTHTGLVNVGGGVGNAALALGLSEKDKLFFIELPIALPTILSGIKTSAVINVGTATIAAFIGAGGYGERIAAGLAINDTSLLLAGAIPAAILALAIQYFFEWLEKRAIPTH